jgi:hypothetical protein
MSSGQGSVANNDKGDLGGPAARLTIGQSIPGVAGPDGQEDII